MAGIDPGTQKFGAAVLDIAQDFSTAHFRALYYQELKGASMGERLRDLETGLDGFFTAWGPLAAVAFEVEFAGRNWNTMAQLAKGIGISEMVAVRHAKVAVFSLNPSSARRLAAHGAMGYPQMRAFLHETYGLDTSEAAIPEDALSAMLQAHALRTVLADPEQKLDGVRAVYRAKSPPGELLTKRKTKRLAA